MLFQIHQIRILQKLMGKYHRSTLHHRLGGEKEREKIRIHSNAEENQTEIVDHHKASKKDARKTGATTIFITFAAKETKQQKTEITNKQS